MKYKGIKAKAWAAVQRGCKRRDGDTCYTCPRKGPEWSYDCGHYRPTAIVGANNTRNWLPQVIHRQCSRCNGAGQGEQVAYRAHLVKDYGEEWVAEYDRQVAAKQVSPVKNWQEVIDTWDAV